MSVKLLSQRLVEKPGGCPGGRLRPKKDKAQERIKDAKKRVGVRVEKDLNGEVGTRLRGVVPAVALDQSCASPC